MKAESRSRRWAAVGGMLAAGALLAGCATSAAATRAAPATVAAVPLRTAPAFQVRDVRGQTVTVPAGRPVVLLFGAASGCVSCAVSEQQMAQVYPQFKHQAEFVTVDVMPGDTKADVLSFAQELGASWPAVLAQGTNLLALYHVDALDTMYVLNARGQIVAQADTGLSPAQLRAALQRALQPAGGSGTVSD
jgi:peroxiredoxin